MQTDQLAASLRAYGQSVTAARRAVFRALQGEEPLTMRELVARCGGIDRASVYRTVALFERLGIVQRLQTGWKYKLELSDEFHEHHHHATCLRCGRSIVIPEDDAIEHYLATAAGKINFALQRHQIEIQGLCANCQSSKHIA